MAFDIADIFKDVPKVGPEKKEIVYIHIDDLLDDERNIYRIDEIEELAASIELVGLQQPLNVTFAKDVPGKYRIISGHRRKAAHRRLISEGKEKYEQVACIIDTDVGSEAMQELKLIFGNSNTRQLSAYELALQAERVQELFYVLKEEGVEFPGRMRDHVAAFLGTSKSALSRVKVIMDGLKFEATMRAFQENRLPVSSAYEIARRDEYVQELVEQNLDYIIHRNGEELAVILDEMERKAEQDRQLVSKMQTGIDRLSQEALVEQAKVMGREAAEQYLAQRAQDDEKYFMMLREVASDFFDRLPTMGISRKLNIDALKRRFANFGWVGNDGGCAGGRAGVELLSYSRDFRIDRSWSEFYDMLCAIALEKCKVGANPQDDSDKADDIWPCRKPEWQLDMPPWDGVYWCKVAFGEGAPMFNRLLWRGDGMGLDGDWRMLGGQALSEGVKVIGWWALPEE